MTPSLERRLREVFTHVVQVEAPPPDADLVDGGLLDSLALVELLAAIEVEFGVEIPLDELELDRIRTLGRLAGLIRERGALSATDAA